jgi:type VI protein secretion system component VasA
MLAGRASPRYVKPGPARVVAVAATRSARRRLARRSAVEQGVVLVDGLQRTEAMYCNCGACYGVDRRPIRVSRLGLFAASVVVTDLGAGAVDLAPEDPAGLVQAVVVGP